MKPKEIYDNSQSMNEEIGSDTNYLGYSTYKSNDILKTGRVGEYLGKNIKYGENVYYLTNKGALKLYPSTDVLSISQGRNNCPAGITTITQDPTGETFRENNPYVFTGTNMGSYGSGITESGQSCGYAGSNVFVGELTPVITSYRGCMSSQDPSAIPMTNIGGNSIYTFDQCKELAGRSGYTSFSLNPSQTWGTVTTMINENKTSIINTIDSVYSDGSEIFNEIQTELDYYSAEGQCYASNTPITSSKRTAFTAPELYTLTTVNLNLNQFEFLNTQYLNALNNNTSYTIPTCAIVSKGSNGYSGIYIMLGEETLAQWLPQANCNNGGGVSVIEATYGGNCSATANCSIQNGNYTKNAQTDVTAYGGVSYPSYASITIGSTTNKDSNGNITYSAASSLPSGCDCNDLSYNMTYQCGNISKNITIPDSTSNSTQTTATGAIINLDCSDVYNNCNFGIGISDDGETNLLQGIGTSGITAISLNAPYNGILVKNSSALSGTQVLSTTQVTYDNKLYSVFMAGNYSTEYPGAGGATIGPNQMVVSPSGTCYITLGPNGFFTITYFVKTNACSNKSGNWEGLFPSEGTYIANSGSNSGSTNGSEPLMVYAVNEILNESYTQYLGKKGYVDDDLILHEYPSRMMSTYTQIPGVTISDSNPLTPTTTFTPTSIEQCKVTCDGMSGCNFFINDTTNGIQCSYYSSGTTGTSTGIDLYTKVQPLETNENCPFANSTTISTSDWEYYVKGEMMNTTTPCFITHDNYLNNQIETANQLKDKTQNKLQTQTQETNQHINTWRNSSTEFEERIADIKNLTDSINNMNGIEGFNVGTVNTMFHESQEIQKRNKYRNIFWSFLAITLLIMASRVIYLYLK